MKEIERKITRRDFLKFVGLGAGTLFAGNLLTNSSPVEARVQEDVNKGMDNRPMAKEMVGNKEEDVQWALSLSVDFPIVARPDKHYAQALGVFADGKGYESKIMKIDLNGHLEDTLVFDKKLASLQVITNQTPRNKFIDVKGQTEVR